MKINSELTVFKEIKVIIFDIDNTLLDFKKCALKSMKKAFKKWKIPFNDKYLNTFLIINNRYWDRYENGEITRDYLYEHRWQEIFDTLNINAPGAQFEQDFIKNLYNSYEKVDYVEDILIYLKPKYKLLIASNSSYNEQTSRLRGAGLLEYFDSVYTSEELGAAKPSKDFFNAIDKDLGENIKKNNVLMIGDSVNADIKGAHDYGFKTAWFNFSNSKEESKADFIFDNLLDLKKIL